MNKFWGEYQEFNSGHGKFEMPVWYSSGDTKWTVGFMSGIQGRVWARHIHLGAINIWMPLKLWGYMREPRKYIESDLRPESCKKVRVTRWNQQRRLRDDQSGRRTTIRVWCLRGKWRKCFRNLSIVSNITDRSPKIQVRISVLQALKIHAVINLLVNFQTLWRLLVSFGYKLRNEKKDQRVGPGSRLSWCRLRQDSQEENSTIWKTPLLEGRKEEWWKGQELWALGL